MRKLALALGLVVALGAIGWFCRPVDGLRDGGVVQLRGAWFVKRTGGALADLIDNVDRIDGSVRLVLGTTRREASATGVPCGDYTVLAVVGGQHLELPISLRGADERVALPSPPAPREEAVPAGP